MCAAWVTQITLVYRQTTRQGFEDVPVVIGKYSVVSFPAELQARHGVRTFRLERTCCYEALLVDEERGRLFVGAENHVVSLSLDNISKRAKKLAWPAPVEWREECNWAGKDIGVSVGLPKGDLRKRDGAPHLSAEREASLFWLG